MNIDSSLATLLRHGSEKESFALLFRPEKAPDIDVLEGEEVHLHNLNDLTKILNRGNESKSEKTLLIAPYRQIIERDYCAIDDHKPLIAFKITQHRKVSYYSALDYLPDTPGKFSKTEFFPPDDQYAQIVKQIIEEEIGGGQGANFVIRREFKALFSNYSCESGLTIFKHLLQQEKGAYWIFFIKCQDITLIGASPERHITLDRYRVTMTPISGTYRFPPSGPTREGRISFLSDKKEEDELSMVLDEELKMMTRICDTDVKTHGPFLTPMSHLAHTGYRLEGHSSLPLADILKESMFAPTVTGSPLENATRIIAKYETKGRGYYSGFAALIGGSSVEPTIDSTILIRTLEVDHQGSMSMGLGATLLRTSKPEAETAETRAKAAALQSAMGLSGHMPPVFQDDQVNEALLKYNQRLASFWFEDLSEPDAVRNFKAGKYNAVLIDNEDAFTSMMRYQLCTMGFNTCLSHYSAPFQADSSELLVIGPGPGDPRDKTDKRVINSRKLILDALEQGQPFVAICFGHQILCTMLGFQIAQLKRPNQGVQKTIPFFAKKETVGFYNTFTAEATANVLDSHFGKIDVAFDRDTRQVFGLRGPRFSSMQFHPESVLTIDGPRILYESILRVIS
ncbi:anthranilate synthase family protein [Microbulbifer sp. ANSA003]|uniref:anthranilate synthase family protein n=1 Tax=Microbulbifer sp. ANSA003 TaxID=3243360 RepID=UPI0040418211